MLGVSPEVEEAEESPLEKGKLVASDGVRTALKSV